MIENKLPESSSKRYLNETVLLTGAGGTIGSEILRKIDAKKIIAIDISEYSIYKLQREFGSKIEYIVGDISDKKLIDIIFEKYKIDYIFNAAAYKHVDRMENENNRYSVIKNNIIGILNLCEKLNTGVKQLIHISSDKAVNPTNYMGFTKLWCEKIVQHYSSNTKSKVSIVRFGNILKSSGSFMETLEWQYKNGLPITITDSRMKRYFMTINDAAQLILDTVDLESGNHIYILDMGKQFSIDSLVKNIVGEYNVEYIGIRPGEKLEEELYYEYEILETTKNPLIKKIKFITTNFNNSINSLLVEMNREKICTKKLTEIITTITTS